MEMKKDVVKAETNVPANKAVSNGRVRFSRVVLNLFLALLGRELKQVTVSEVSLDGIFSRIEKEKEKVRKVIVLQTEALEKRDEVSKEETKRIDDEVAMLEMEIADAKNKLQEKLAENEAEKVLIATEKSRGEAIIKNIDQFYGVSE